MSQKRSGRSTKTKDPSILVKLDCLAKDLSDAFGVDAAMVNIQRGDVIHSIGAHPSFGLELAKRRHDAHDTICAETMRHGDIVNIEDAREENRYLTKRYVKDGVVVGYLGIPIRNADGLPVGAVCTITREPRRWTKLEVRYLSQVAENAQLLLIEEAVNLELEALYREFSELDRILSALSSSLSASISVFNRTGELVFASKALAEQVPEREILDLWSNHLVQFLREQDFASPRIYYDLPHTVSFNNGSENILVQSTISNAGLIVCCWTPVANELSDIIGRVH